MLIGIAGKLSSGKTTCANVLVERLGYRKDSYARVLKQAVSIIFDIPMEKLLGDASVKAEIDPRWKMSYREILQRFGTEACRDTFGPNFWVDVLWRRYESGNSPIWRDLVIDDVRFPSEAEAIRNRGGVIIEVIRPTQLFEDSNEASQRQGLWNHLLTCVGIERSSSMHVSELPLPRELVNATIENDASEEHLAMAILRMVNAFKGGS